MKFYGLLVLCFLLLFNSAFALVSVPESNPNAPLRILSVYDNVFSPGEKIPVEFNYKYSCPSAYAIHIYKDNDLSDYVCSRIVKGMGWTVTNTYSGNSCKRTSGSDLIEDVCGISSDAKDGSYTLHVILFDSLGKSAVFQTKVGAIKINSNNPELSVSSVDFPESSVGQKIPVKVFVSNSGLKDSSIFNVSLYFNSASGKTFIGEKQLQQLKEGASDKVEFVFDSSFLAPGEYILEAVVDSGFDVIEQNENNNSFQKKIVLNASSEFPDLFVVSVDHLNSVNQGDLLPLVVKIKNNGLTDVLDSFLVSVLDGKGNSIESRIVYGLNAGKEKTISFFVSSSDFSGKTELSVSIDKVNSLGEASKSNNSSTFSFNVVSGNTVLAEKCFNNIDDDLDGIIDEECKADYSVELGDFIVLSSGEKMFPLADPVSGIKKFRFDLSQVPDFFVVPFDVKVLFGEEKDYFKEFNDKEFCVYVSDKKKNNELFLVFSAKAGNSAEKKQLSFLEFVDSFGSSFSYFWVVEGKAKKLPENYLSSLYSRKLSGKDDSGFYFNPKLLGFDSGEFELTFTSDCYGKDNDADVSNDFSSFAVKIASKEEDNGIDDNDNGIIDEGFDLVLEDFYFEENLLAGETESNAVVKIKNNGKFVSPQVGIDFFLNEAKEKNIIFSDKITSIEPGETKTFSFSIPSAVFSGTENKVIALIDFQNSFAESDESNNQKESILLKYSDSVNLKISELDADREIVSPGAKVKLTAKIKNNGFVDSSDFFVVLRDSLSNQIVDSVKVSNLKAGIELQNLKEFAGIKQVFFADSKLNFDDLSSVTVEYDYVLPAGLTGNKGYDVCISFSENSSEIDSENCRKIFFVVSSQADLRVNYFKPVNDLSVRLGNLVLLELEMENQGLLEAEDFSLELYYYTKENKKMVINSVSGFSLASGKKEKVLLSVDFSEEINGSVFAELDSTKKVFEDDESNNIVSVNLYSYLVEKCYNAVDDDLDGTIDEGCPARNFVLVSGDTVKEDFVLDVMREKLVLGQLQKIVLYHSVFGPITEEKITVVSPSGKSFDFFTGPEGSVSFITDELGTYQVLALVKSAEFKTSFKVISEEEEAYSFVFLAAEFFFGSPEQTNPFLIPVLLLLAFIASSYAFSKCKRHCFDLSDFFVVKPNYGTGLSIIIAVIFFFLALFSNKFFGILGFIVLIALELFFVYSFQKYFESKIQKKKSARLDNERDEFENNKKENLEKEEKEKSTKNKKGSKKKFVLKL